MRPIPRAHWSRWRSLAILHLAGSGLPTLKEDENMKTIAVDQLFELLCAVCADYARTL